MGHCYLIQGEMGHFALSSAILFSNKLQLCKHQKRILAENAKWPIFPFNKDCHNFLGRFEAFDEPSILLDLFQFYAQKSKFFTILELESLEMFVKNQAAQMLLLMLFLLLTDLVPLVQRTVFNDARFFSMILVKKWKMCRKLCKAFWINENLVKTSR